MRVVYYPDAAADPEGTVREELDHALGEDQAEVGRAPMITVGDWNRAPPEGPGPFRGRVVACGIGTEVHGAELDWALSHNCPRPWAIARGPDPPYPGHWPLELVWLNDWTPTWVLASLRPRASPRGRRSRKPHRSLGTRVPALNGQVGVPRRNNGCYAPTTSGRGLPSEASAGWRPSPCLARKQRMEARAPRRCGPWARGSIGCGAFCGSPTVGPEKQSEVRPFGSCGNSHTTGLPRKALKHCNTSTAGRQRPLGKPSCNSGELGVQRGGPNPAAGSLGGPNGPALNPAHRNCQVTARSGRLMAPPGSKGPWWLGVGCGASAPPCSPEPAPCRHLSSRPLPPIECGKPSSEFHPGRLWGPTNGGRRSSPSSQMRGYRSSAT